MLSGALKRKRDEKRFQTINLPLLQAVDNDDVPGIRAAIANGADIMVRDENDYTMLHRAVEKQKSLATIQALLAEGADVNAVTEKRQTTPLHLASMGGKLAILEILLDHGAVIKENTVGRTPLHIAVLHQNFPLVKALVLGGANRDITDEIEHTALDWAEKTEDNEIIHFLKNEIPALVEQCDACADSWKDFEAEKENEDSIRITNYKSYLSWFPREMLEDTLTCGKDDKREVSFISSSLQNR